MYDFHKIEKKWQNFWEENKTFKTDVYDFSKPKYYVLDMFPYPSGHGLHVGHPEGYTATDIIARMKRMQGYNVLHPMGFDSFGLPAEQYAIKTGKNPMDFTENNIKTFVQQLKMLGFSFDWDRQISTCEPKYYKWTQWIFVQLFNAGLARQIDTSVNWCEELGTVLANDEIINGKSERGGFPVVRKKMKQWILDIPAYAERLLEGLNDIDWPESTKEMQRNWIGKSEGALVDFEVANSNEKFTVYTTRADTLFGATYCVLSPEHPLVNTITAPNCEQNVKKYQQRCATKSDLERTELNKDKTGVFTGAYALNPVNKKYIPIWISDYVLMSYGTGAIMAVPAHDERDYEFAKKYKIDIIPVIDGGNIEKEAYTGDGLHINSGFIDGLNKSDAIEKMIAWLEENNIGKKKTNYRMREWIFARQRYWGEPVPVVNLKDGTQYALKENELPLVLPALNDYKPQNGKAPLDNDLNWKNVNINGKKGERETSTMPGSAGSSWYFLRYIDPNNETEIADYKLLKHWLPVDLYVGGPEHSVGHLLYSRFWNNFLYDSNVVPVKEPFKKLRHPGMILGENGEKMSKSRGNVVNPNEIVERVGADSLRLYEMFMGPINADKPWDGKGADGSKKFLDRVYRLYHSNTIKNSKNNNLEKIYHQTVKKVTQDYETLDFNTAISQMMIFLNGASKEEIFPVEYAEGFIKLLYPITPHIAEEIWNTVLKHNDTITFEQWPIYDEQKTKESVIEMIVQVNGKLRGKATIPAQTKQEEMKKIALSLESVQNYVTKENIANIIIIPGKLVSIVTKN